MVAIYHIQFAITVNLVINEFIYNPPNVLTIYVVSSVLKIYVQCAQIYVLKRLFLRKNVNHVY